MGVLAALGDVSKTLESAGLVPNKYLGLASGLAAIGVVAAKISKTPSPAIAAAVSPAQMASGMSPPPTTAP
jgi:hypothetical protein